MFCVILDKQFCETVGIRDRAYQWTYGDEGKDGDAIVGILCQYVKVVVESLTADGDELHYVRMHFHNVPIRNHETTWFGEMATFILNNLYV